MIDVNDQYERQVAARLLDFCRMATPWHRGLWGLGLVLTLKEILEASEAVRSGILHPPALGDLARSAMALAGRDPGVGSAQQLAVLENALRSEIRFAGMEYRVLEQLVADIEPMYLKRWAAALRNAAARPKPERTARGIAGYLLDAGFSADFLHRWWSFKQRHEMGIKPIADILEDAHTLAGQPQRQYKVLVAFSAFTKRRDSMPSGWLDAPEVSRWLRDRKFKVGELRQRGGILLPVTARDAVAAVHGARERLERFAARVLVGSDREFKLIPKAWVDGESREFRLTSDRRGVDVHALEREKQVYADREYSRVDAAIELLEPLASSSPATAAASGWAAFEALLSEPGDHAVVANRMGAIVACSFPRAELTMLSYQAAKADASLANRLGLCATNRDRADLVAGEIAGGAPLPVQTDSDRAACERMRKLLASPHAVLKDIESYASAAFRRLYRQRNLVLHGGITGGVALRASLRTAAPLVGAGMDRIAHAWFVDHISPLELAARARISLDTVGATYAPKCVDLLARRV
jgi:hypothetical protein